MQDIHSTIRVFVKNLVFLINTILFFTILFLSIICIIFVLYSMILVNFYYYFYSLKEQIKSITQFQVFQPFLCIKIYSMGFALWDNNSFWYWFFLWWYSAGNYLNRFSEKYFKMRSNGNLLKCFSTDSGQVVSLAG